MSLLERFPGCYVQAPEIIAFLAVLVVVVGFAFQEINKLYIYSVN